MLSPSFQTSRFFLLFFPFLLHLTNLCILDSLAGGSGSVRGRETSEKFQRAKQGKRGEIVHTGESKRGREERVVFSLLSK